MLLALANNGTRQSILEEFDQLLQTELPRAEQQYIQNGIGCCTNGCKPGCKHHKQAPQLCYLSRNATFTSLKGFFNTQLAHEDTMSPLQREMIRLAQILKARLVTEMEYKQRVMERGLIEERLDSAIDSNTQLDRERRTQESLVIARDALVQARSVVIPATSRLIAIPDQVNAILSTARPPISDLTEVLNIAFPADPKTNGSLAGVKAKINSLYGERVRATALKRSSKSVPIFLPGEPDARIALFAATPEQAQQFSGPTQYRLAIRDDKELSKDVSVDKQLFLMVNEKMQQSLLARLGRINDSLAKVRTAVEPFHAADSSVITGIQDLQTRLSTAINFITKNQNAVLDGFYPVATIDEIVSLLNQIEPLIVRADNCGQMARKLVKRWIALSRLLAF